jgi:hypothetical protein
VFWDLAIRVSIAAVSRRDAPVPGERLHRAAPDVMVVASWPDKRFPRAIATRTAFAPPRTATANPRPGSWPR